MPNAFAKIGASLILAVLPLFLLAQTPQELFELGTRAYRQSDYKAAAAYFEESAQKGFGAAAYHNAANSYAKMSQNGLAMLNYERARYLKPRSPETVANISALSKVSGTPEKKRSFADVFFGELSNFEWAMLAISSFWIGIIIVSTCIIFRKKGNFAKISLLLSSLAFIISIAGTIYWSDMRNTAISVSQDGVLKLSPAKNAPAIAPFPEGRRGIIKERRGEYLRLQTPDKKIGWASLENVKPLR